MWKLIKDCGKHLTVETIVRERVDNSFLVYKIIEVEFDQYKLELTNRDNLPVEEKIHNILNCDQLLQYHFEVEEHEYAGEASSLTDKKNA
jgi:hypothetical protein